MAELMPIAPFSSNCQVARNVLYAKIETLDVAVLSRFA
jgi:hypothetical protein